MKFLLLLSITVIFVATGAEGLKCNCCGGSNNTGCPDTDCDDNGESSIPVDCRFHGHGKDFACFTQKQGLKISFSDAAVATASFNLS